MEARVPTSEQTAMMSPVQVEFAAHELEFGRRRFEAASAMFMLRVDACGAHLADGHRRIAAWGRATNNWSTAESMKMAKLQKATLDPAKISKLDGNGKLLAGDPPSKESFLHLAMYEERSNSAAVVHLHSLHAVAVSCLDGVDPGDVFPPITAYAIMQVGKLALVPYYPPGDQSLADAVRKLAGRHHAVLLANHGPVVAGSSLNAAVNAIEELEIGRAHV